MQNNPKLHQKLTKHSWIIIPFVFIIILWIGWFLLLFFLPGCVEQKGQIGDLFGGINALFTGLALAALGISILFQRKEIEHQIEEIERSKELIESQQHLHGETLRQNAKIALINYYSKKLEALRESMNKNRAPETKSEFEVIEARFFELLKEIENHSIHNDERNS